MAGDVNCDGEVYSTHALIIMKFDVALPIPEGNCLDAGDVNDDGIVNSTHAIAIVSYDAGIFTPFPVGEPR